MTRGVVNRLEGTRFGHLLILQRAGKDKQSNAQWLCRCDCGNEVVVRANNLRRGQFSCSRKCRFNPAAKVKDIGGQIFGELTCKKFLGRGVGGKARWSFSCSCGAELELPSDAVLNAGQKSCGKGVHASAYRHGLANTRGYKSMHFMKYLAAKANRTPAWLTQAEIDEMAQMYISAAEMSKGGTLFEVDHYYPLQGKKVSGLHVPANLRIVTRSANRTKSNLHPDDVC